MTTMGAKMVVARAVVTPRMVVFRLGMLVFVIAMPKFWREDR